MLSNWSTSIDDKEDPSQPRSQRLTFPSVPEKVNQMKENRAWFLLIFQDLWKTTLSTFLPTAPARPCSVKKLVFKFFLNGHQD